MVRMRAFGIYSYKLADPSKFYKEVSGTRETYTVDDLDGQLRNLVVAGMSNLFGESGVPFIDMAGNQAELGVKMKEALLPVFERYGLALDAFAVQNVSLPEELQQMLDKRIGVNMIGGMQAYTQLQTAEAIPLAAQNEGGLAGLGAGVGAGLTVGQVMGQAMMQSMTPGSAPAAPSAMPPAAPAATVSPDDVVATLEKLHGLVAKGILTQAEFDAKKAELLSKLS